VKFDKKNGEVINFVCMISPCLLNPWAWDLKYLHLSRQKVLKEGRGKG
jgi:hypothetical protein